MCTICLCEAILCNSVCTSAGINVPIVEAYGVIAFPNEGRLWGMPLSRLAMASINTVDFQDQHPGVLIVIQWMATKVK